MKCKIKGCDNPSYRRGICNAHRLRYQRNGTYETKVNVGQGYSIDHRGYVTITVDGRRVYEHVYLAEKALGKKLPKGAEVHHMNNKPWDNYTSLNLVICPDREYHKLLHKRMKELGYENN